MVRRELTVAFVLLLMVSVAFAYSELRVSPRTQEIKVGTNGTYTVTLDTDSGNGSLHWDTNSPNILARIGGVGTFKKNGFYDFTSTGVDGQTFTLEVQPQDGVTINQKYKTTVTYKNQLQEAEATVTASTIPTPEPATIVTAAVGLIGLVSLVRYRKKD